MKAQTETLNTRGEATSPGRHCWREARASAFTFRPPFPVPGAWNQEGGEGLGAERGSWDPPSLPTEERVAAKAQGHHLAAREVSWAQPVTTSLVNASFSQPVRP